MFSGHETVTGSTPHGSACQGSSSGLAAPLHNLTPLHNLAPLQQLSDSCYLERTCTRFRVVASDRVSGLMTHSCRLAKDILLPNPSSCSVIGGATMSFPGWNPTVALGWQPQALSCLPLNCTLINLRSALPTSTPHPQAACPLFREA